MLIVLCLNCRVDAQTLNLGNRTAPELGHESYANHIARELTFEISDRLGLMDSVTETRQLVLKSQCTFRMAAERLAQLGHEAGSEGSAAIVAAATLYNNRDDIDHALMQLVLLYDRLLKQGDRVEPTVLQHYEFIRDSLNVFINQSTLIESLDSVDSATLDDILPRLFQPLAEALATLEGDTVQTQWLPRSESSPQSQVIDINELQERLFNGSFLDDHQKTQLASYIDDLTAAVEFPEYRQQTLSLFETISAALELYDSAERAEWLDSQIREDIVQHVTTHLLQLMNIETRSDSQATLKLIATMQPTLDSLTQLMAMKQRRVRPEIFNNSIAGIVQSLTHSENLSHTSELLSRLHTIAKTAEIYRDLSRERLPSEFQVAVTKLARAYESAEDVLFSRLSEASTSPISFSDPAFLSLYNNQQSYLNDIAYVRQMPGWLEMIRQNDPRWRDGFANRFSRLARHLTDPVRRPEAVARLSQFEQLLAAFQSLPFENTLRQSTELASRLTGGQHDKLTAYIDSLRNEWANATATNVDTASIDQKLIHLRNVMQAMQDVSELVSHSSENSSTLDRWAAWELPSQVNVAVHREMPNRLRLAVNALLSAKHDRVQYQLDKLAEESPMTLLMGRLYAKVIQSLNALSNSPTGVVNQLAFPPTRDSYLYFHRDTIADVCRYTFEADFAEANDRASLANACHVYVHNTANALISFLNSDDS